jgi:putative transposase
MARLARVVLPNYPHHITQRGNRRQDVFFHAEDYTKYLDLISHWCREEGIAIWSYCLMTNHVHLIVTPQEGANLSRAIGEAHRRYTRYVNFRENWRGYLWQGRFASFPMDEPYLLSAVAYVELNPVQAGMVKAAWDYPWSSVHAHLAGKSDGYVEVAPLLHLVPDWIEFLQRALDQPVNEFEVHERTGRPLGSESFIEKASKIVGRDLKPKKPGPKPTGN